MSRDRDDHFRGDETPSPKKTGEDNTNQRDKIKIRRDSEESRDRDGRDQR